MFTRKRIIIGAVVIVGIPALALAWWLLSPLFTTTTVNEDFPLAANAVLPAEMVMDSGEAVMVETMADAETMMRDAAGEWRKYDERVPVEMAMPDDSSMMDASVVKVKTGSFRDGGQLPQGQRHGDYLPQRRRHECAALGRFPCYKWTRIARAASAECQSTESRRCTGLPRAGQAEG